MASYRVFFRGTNDQIVGREDFDAGSDSAAAAMAEILFDACCDVAFEFELWEGPRRVERQGWRASTLEAIAEHRQERLIQHEERLRDSRWAVASSRRLLDTLEAWRRHDALS